MKPLRTLLMVLVLGVVTFAPLAAFAADATFFGPIIPKECHCEGSAPDWGCVVQTIQNGINFAVTLGIIIFTLVIAYAGAMYMASGANPGQHKAAVKMIQNVLLGLLVMLSAWIMVDFVMGVLYDSERAGFGPWEAILADGDNRMCLEVNQNQPQAPGTATTTAETGDPVVGTTTPQQPATNVQGCPNCAVVTGIPRKASGTACDSGAGCNVNGGCDPQTSPPLQTPVSECMINRDLLEALQDVETSLSWQVTEMWPPTVDHTNACHGNGTCVDVAIRTSSPTAAQIADFGKSFTGMRAVFETTSCSLRDAVRSFGVEAHCSSEPAYSHIRGNHFSIYR